MVTKVLFGADAEALLRNQIEQHTAGIEDSLSVFSARSAIEAWVNALRGVEEIINLPRFQLDDDDLALSLLNLPMDNLSRTQVANLQDMLADRFDAGVAQRFVQTLLRSAAIGQLFRLHGFECGEMFRTLGGVIDYFQSRRRQMVALLYWMPVACRGSELVAPLDALNVFLPIVEHSCVGLTSLHRDLVLLRVHDDFELTVEPDRCTANYSYDMLDESSLEPERVGITEVPRDKVDMSILTNQLKVDAGLVFSVPEMCNDLLAMEASYAEFELGRTEFGSVAQFIVACARYVRDEYYIEIDGAELESLMGFCGLSALARRRLVYAGTGYADAINSFAPFISFGRKFLTTVTLLIRFAYSWKTSCLNKIKRFQVRSGFIFEQQVKDALAEQGFVVSEIKRIDRKEFDVVATKEGGIFNVQCKNNLIDLTRMAENPNLFARYNKRLDRYYGEALVKEERREELLHKAFGLQKIQHIVLSKFPVATRNPRVLAFRDIKRFEEMFGK